MIIIHRKAFYALIAFLFSIGMIASVIGDDFTQSIIDNNVIHTSLPENGSIIWIDVVPPHIDVVGDIKTSGDLLSIVATSKGWPNPRTHPDVELFLVDCENNSSFNCTIPVTEGRNTVTITASVVTGATISETRNFTVEIGPPPPLDISINGYVTTPSGDPVEGAMIISRSPLRNSKNKPFTVSATTAEDGAYSLQNAVEFRQNISVQKDGYIPFSQNILFSNISNELNITLEAVSTTSPGFDLPICLAGILVLAGVLYISRRTRE